MKILIGTPIHAKKNYAMERWLANVAKLQKKFPADLLLVDNTPGMEYVEKVKGYLAKNGITNYKIEHLELHPWTEPDERISRSREIIRQHVLNHSYDAWFSWESDQIIPPNTLGILARIMAAGNYMLIHPSSWSREVPAVPDVSFGVCLINRAPLEKFGFLLEFGLEPGMRKAWNNSDVWFKKQVLKAGGSYIEVYGLIKPIYHLDK
ncbi:MAG: hypothetical protein UV59_C0033G0010 [Candidatus Gottesmanbacteria bacterium GW2011_GWA1_43_11]|uniref:Glycosyltransferase n=1 Tax=Candidatus Gottesmanbacteria bacterium GW2011_GWA1_43_11 TaxID=1618436 RepID=A0A0G1CDV2_9BACT|nr:MAG: hypothetical protein UV59_C0033G0010 [Candidatus Gottesmanbacteria bacterium GW2011_GWA1_43_11]